MVNLSQQNVLAAWHTGIHPPVKACGTHDLPWSNLIIISDLKQVPM